MFKPRLLSLMKYYILHRRRGSRFPAVYTYGKLLFCLDGGVARIILRKFFPNFGNLLFLRQNKVRPYQRGHCGV